MLSQCTHPSPHEHQCTGNQGKTWFWWHIGTHHENVTRVLKKWQKAAFTMGTTACAARLHTIGPASNNESNFSKWICRFYSILDLWNILERPLEVVKPEGRPKKTQSLIVSIQQPCQPPEKNMGKTTKSSTKPRPRRSVPVEVQAVAWWHCRCGRPSTTTRDYQEQRSRLHLPKLWTAPEGNVIQSYTY